MLAVKIYRRPAAGRELPLPEDIRPPEVLCQTLDYLFYDLLPSDPTSPRFTAVQPFMWNRTRAIRQDFIVQGESGRLAIECHERIARYHILCLHWRGGIGAEGWSEQQELEQLRKTIRSLTEFYEDLRKSNKISSPNEPEFRAYNLLLHLSDPETLREVEDLPVSISDSNAVKVALKLRAYAQRSNNTVRRGRPANTEATMNLWARFFGELRKSNNGVGYLLACLCENIFPQVRAGALKAMGKTYLTQHAPIPLDYLQRSLGMDTEEEVCTFAVALGAEKVFSDDAESQVVGLRLSKVNDDVPLPSAVFSKGIVEAKRSSCSCQDVVDGKSSNFVSLAKEEDSSPPSMSHLSSIPSPRLPLSSAEKRPFSKPLPDTQSSQQVRESVKDEKFTLSASATSFVPSNSLGHAIANEKGHINISQGTNDTSNTITTQMQIPLNNSPLTQGASPSKKVKSAEVMQPFNFLPKKENPQLQVGKFMASSDGAKVPVVSEVKTLPPPATYVAPAATKELNVFGDTSKYSAAQNLQNLKEPEIQTSNTVSTIQPSKRTVESVTGTLLSDLIHDFVSHKIQSLAEQAYLRQLRIRRSSRRSQFIDHCVKELSSSVFEEQLEGSVILMASESAADEMDRRSKEKQFWSRWRQQIEVVREQRKQTERLQHVRDKLGSRQVRPKSTRRDKRHYKHHLIELEDRDLELEIRNAREDRQGIWMPSTFLWTLASQFEKLPTSSISTWTIVLSVISDTAPSSLWLKSKLSVAQETHAVMPLLHTDLHVVDIMSCPIEDLRGDRDVGLVIFELDPSLALDKTNQNVWAKQRNKLHQLATSEFVEQSLFKPKLLLVSWSSSEAKASAEDERKYVFKHLELGATDRLRYMWGQIELWEVGNATSPQISFEDRTSHLLSTIEWNHSQHALSFEDVLNTSSHPWRAMLDRTEASMTRLATHVGPHLSQESIDHAHDLVRETFAIVTALAQRVLEDILAVSNLVADENLQESILTFPVPRARQESSEADKLGDALAFDLALTQLQNLMAQGYAYENVDSPVHLLRSWLLGQISLTTSETLHQFPWVLYFAQLLQIGTIPLQQNWLEATLPSTEEITQELESSLRLNERAALEIQWKVRDFLHSNKLIGTKDKEHLSDQPLQAISNRTKRRGGAIEQEQLLTNKVRKTSSQATPARGAVASLRSLMGSANQLLQ